MENPIIITKRNVDSQGNPVSIKLIETRQIFQTGAFIVLKQVPSEYYGVQIQGYKEIFDIEKMKNHEFKVDYAQGVIYFHPKAVGKTVVIDYYGTGYDLISCSRIFTKYDKYGNVVETLEEVLDKIYEVEPIINRLTKSEELIDQIHVDLEDAKELQPLLHNDVIQGRQTKEELEQTISSAQDDISTIKATGNDVKYITKNQWVLNSASGMYEYTLPHTMNSKALTINCYYTDTDEFAFIGGKIIDKNNILFKNEEAVNLTVVLNSKYYKPQVTLTSEIAEEVVEARKGKVDLKTKMDEVDLQLEQIVNNHLDINVMDYGAKGDGIVDDSQAINDLINSTNNNIYQTIIFPQGRTFKIDKGIYINNKKRLLITGGGNIIDGTIHIQGDSASDRLDITIKDINFDMVYGYEYQPKEISAITLNNCSHVNIYDCRFRYYGRTIKFERPTTPIHQPISRIDIQRCTFENVGYCLYNDNLPENYYLTGDTSFQNNNIYLAWEGVIKLDGADGLMFNNNTVFTPRHELTKDMIYLKWFNYVRISNNQLFESGLSTIKAIEGENLNIVNNSIPYGGQNALSSAIDVLDCVMVSIQGNNIERSTDYGINIKKGSNYCSFINISNNIIRDIGVNPHYRGNDLNSSKKIPINVYDGVTRCLVDSNVTDRNIEGVFFNGNNVYDNKFQKQLDLDTKIDKNKVTFIAQPNELSLSGSDTLIKMMVNKNVITNFITDDNGKNMIVDDTGAPRELSFIQIDTYRSDFNIIQYVASGDVRNKFTQHKVYQIF